MRLAGVCEAFHARQAEHYECAGQRSVLQLTHYQKTQPMRRWRDDQVRCGVDTFLFRDSGVSIFIRENMAGRQRRQPDVNPSADRPIRPPAMWSPGYTFAQKNAKWGTYCWEKVR